MRAWVIKKDKKYINLCGVCPLNKAELFSTKKEAEKCCWIMKNEDDSYYCRASCVKVVPVEINEVK